MFLSAGKCISHFSNRKVPYCVKFNPDEDKQNLFVAGMSDKKIVQVTSVGVNHLCVNPVSTAACHFPARVCVAVCGGEVLVGVSSHCRLPAFDQIFLHDNR